MKLIDDRGHVLENLERSANGAIIVRDEKSLNTYKNEQKRALEVIDLKQQVADMQKLMLQLLKK